MGGESASLTPPGGTKGLRKRPRDYVASEMKPFGNGSGNGESGAGGQIKVGVRSKGTNENK